MEDIFTTTISGEDLDKLERLMNTIVTMQHDDVLDNADMKLIFKVSDKTLYRWRKKGHLLYTKLGGKFYYSRRVLYATIYQRLANQYPQHQLPKLF